MPSPPDTSIQTATVAFAEAMGAIHAAAFPPAEAWGSNAFAVQLGMPGVIGLVHPAGGMILVRAAADEAEILTIAVAPTARRAGIAEALLRRAFTVLAESGVSTLFLEVSEGNAAALALYEKAGFIEAGRRRAYYPDGSDARIMRRDLKPAALRGEGP